MVIGRRTRTSGSEERVSGRIAFVTSQEPSGTLHAALRRSDVAHGDLLHVDTSHLDIRGVHCVLTGADLGGLEIDPYFGPVFKDQPVLAIDRVRYIGEPIAAVAASSEKKARAVAACIDASVRELPAVFDPILALSAEAPILHESTGTRSAGFADIIIQRTGGNVCNKFTLKRGDVETGFAEAAHIFEHEFRSPALHHLAMEPHAAIAYFEGARLTVITATQTPYVVRDALAEMFRLPASKVRVIVPPLGGGFGGKTYAKVEPIAAVLASITDRPVKIVLPRDEDFLTGSKHEAVIRIRVGLDSSGRILAKHVRAFFNAGAYTDISPRLVKNGGYATNGPYRIPNVDIESVAVFTNFVPAGAFRGYGVSQAAWAYESQMDIVARELGMDRIEFRRRNLIGKGDPFATGESIHGAHFAELLDDALELFSRPLTAVIGPYEAVGRGSAVIIKSTITPSTSQALIHLYADGSMQILSSTVEMGQGAHTALSQIAADALGLDVEQIHVLGPDTSATPYDITTSSSRSTAAMGAAVKDACETLQRELVRIALAGADAEGMSGEAHVADGHVYVSGNDPIAFSEIVRRSRMGTLSALGAFRSEGGLDPVTGQGIASDHWHQGALAVEVAVDRRTGKVRILRARVSVYAGTVVNPINAKMQVEGSVLFGISQALYEQIQHDDGFIINPNLSDYAVAGLKDLPEHLEINLVEHEDDDQIHGLGETALPLVAPAIANAIDDAVGARIMNLPMTAESVLNGME